MNVQIRHMTLKLRDGTWLPRFALETVVGAVLTSQLFFEPNPECRYATKAEAAQRNRELALNFCSFNLPDAQLWEPRANH